MIAFLFLCCYLFLTTVSFGLLTTKLAGRLWHDNDSTTLFPADILSIIGLVSIGTLLNYYSLLFKTGGIVPHGIIMAVAGMTIVVFRSDWKKLIQVVGGKNEFLKNALLILPVIISIMFYAVQWARVYDTGLYHAQSIQWIEKYRCIPGLGNLHFRLAFNSSFFVLSALYGFSFLTGQTFYSLNPYLCMLFAVSILMNIMKSISSGDRHLVFVYLFIFIAYYYLLEAYISSPSPDLISAIMVFYLFLLVIRERGSFFRVDTLMAIALISSFLLTIKLSQAPVLLFILCLFLNKELRLTQRFLMGLLVPIVIVLPWMIRNVVLSGYLVYPLPGFDLFSFDWKIPADSVMAEKNWIRSWAIMPGENPNEVLTLSLGAWFPAWFYRHSGFYRFSLMVCFFSPLIVAAAWIKNRLSKELMMFWFVCFAGFVFWFVSAPDIRFAYGFILFCAAIPLSAFTDPFRNVRQKALSWSILVFIVLFGLVHAIAPQMRTSPAKFAEHVWKPEKLPEVRVVEKKARNLFVSVPVEGVKCYNSAIPCTPYFNPDLEMRENRVEDGFRIASQ